MGQAFFWGAVGASSLLIGAVVANPDGTTDLYFGPTAPEGKESNWLQTVPGTGWWTILRLYGRPRSKRSDPT